MILYLFISFVYCNFSIIPRNQSNSVSWRFSPWFSSKNFINFSLMFRYLIHFESVVIHMLWGRDLMVKDWKLFSKARKKARMTCFFLVLYLHSTGVLPRLIRQEKNKGIQIGNPEDPKNLFTQQQIQLSFRQQKWIHKSHSEGSEYY